MKISSIIAINFTVLLLASCSLKKSKEPVSGNFVNLPPVATTLSVKEDADQDGISDGLEIKLERDDKTGNFPRFSVSRLNHTQITLKDLGQDNQESVIEYNTSDNSNYGIEYNPVRDKLAKNSYQRAIGWTQVVEPINVFDFGIVKLSNFNEEQLEDIKKIVKKYQNDDALHTVTLKSIFTLNADMVKGITKLYDIKCELGFIDDGGSFNSFGSVFDLMSTDRTRIVFSSVGTAESLNSNMEAMVFIDRLEVSDLSSIFNNNYDLALKVHNYKADTLDKLTFEYSDQVKKALAVGTLFAISNKKDDHIFFNSRSEKVEETLKRLLGDIESDSEGTLTGVGDSITNTSYPIIFENGGNDHLRQSSWHLFSETSRLYDIPAAGDRVMAGFFSNKELAKAGNRTIKVAKNNVVSDIAIACAGNSDCVGRLSTSSTISPKKSSIPLNNLNVGEVVKISIKGNNIYPIPSAEEIKKVKVRHEWERCQCYGGGDDCPDPSIEDCSRQAETYFCDYRWRSLGYEKRPLSNLNAKFLSDNFSLKSKKRVSNILFSDKGFFNLHRPIYQEESDSWEISFLVTEEFLSAYGEFNSLVFPEKKENPFRTGYMGLLNNNCIEQGPVHTRGEYNFGSRWSPDARDDRWRPYEDNEAIVLRDYEVQITREFK